MRADLLLDPAALRRYGGGDSLADLAHVLLRQQQETWEMLRAGYDSLRQVRVRRFAVGAGTILVQFNPGRITSSSAKVDDKSIRERRCFLCVDTLPDAQRGVPADDSFLLLCNPFPIFPEHFTISSIEHRPQEIAGGFRPLLRIARALGARYTVFYNGPKCGASAPDHMHFQAGTRRFMPLEEERTAIRTTWGKQLLDARGLGIWGVDDGVRRWLEIESGDESAAAAAFEGITAAMEGENGEEPMMNVVVLHDGAWHVLVFPRVKHRPSFYFAEGAEKLLISPAAVDLCGVTITPREEDYGKVTGDHLRRMYEEIAPDRETFAELSRRVAASVRA